MLTAARRVRWKSSGSEPSGRVRWSIVILTSRNCPPGAVRSSQRSLDLRQLLPAKRVTKRGHELGHEDDRQPLDRIDEEIGREDAAPIIFAGAARHHRFHRIEIDHEAEAKALA